MFMQLISTFALRYVELLFVCGTFLIDRDRYRIIWRTAGITNVVYIRLGSN